MEINTHPLDTSREKVVKLDLETLSCTQPENDIEGNPIGGYRHADLIKDIMQIAENNGLTPTVKKMWAANNRDTFRPGISVLPDLVKQYGENTAESHLIRRVFCVLDVGNDINKEFKTAIAIAYHQTGIQIGIGPNVNICTNQCILSPEFIFSNTGKQKLKSPDPDFPLEGEKFYYRKIDSWLHNLRAKEEQWQNIVSEMSITKISRADLNTLLGELYTMRIQSDFNDKQMPSPEAPFTQTQLNRVTEAAIYQIFNQGTLSFWDFANMGTAILKPQSADLPNILPNTSILFEYLKSKL